ncbi:MAG: lamin tail domain-containing protein [Candidatus Paceibacterota bacterium]
MKRFLITILFIGGIIQTHALIISEVMYDPEGSDTSCACEWVEVFNDSESPVDFSSWKFFENDTNHGLVSNIGGAIIPPNSYAVIADNPTKFLTANQNFSGILFDSVFSGMLSNSGEHISIKESSSGTEISPVDYDPSLGGGNDGSSLSKIGGVWVRGKATPGAENQPELEEVKSLASSLSVKTNSQTTISQKSPPAPDIVFYMPFEKVVVAGAESYFSTYGLTHSGKIIDDLVCDWAFGDGGQATGTSTKYRYAYPGRYIAQVEGNNGYVTWIGRMTVHVVPPDISITKIEKGKYGWYVDILNPNTYELDLSQWKLSINGSIFPFPKNTLIASKGVTHFSGASMGFANITLLPDTVVKIMFPNQEEVTRFTLNNNVTNQSDSQGVVLGTSTTKTPLVLSNDTKPVVKNIRKIPTAEKVSTTTQTVNKTKDRRIIVWFKSLFGR